MKTRLLLPLMVALLGAAATVLAGDEAPRGLAADCVACARSCPQPCVPRAGKCVCTANERIDCRNACETSAGSDAAALERCRNQCRTKVPGR